MTSYKALFNIILSLLLGFQTSSWGQGTRSIENWLFQKESGEWQEVTVPHDWAISGPFDRNNDLQRVAIVQNGETTAREHTARSGGLPWTGKGCYKTTLEIPETEGRHFDICFDGAMSNARVLVNGCEAGCWPYGYNAFHLDITPFVKEGPNEITVHLDNPPQSSRWYPGAGLYRKVELIDKSSVHVPVWGTHITTECRGSKSYITVETEIEGCFRGETISLHTTISDDRGRVVAESRDARKVFQDIPPTQIIVIDNPSLWSVDNPALYTARTVVCRGEEVCDTVITRFGIRDIDFRPFEGFFLNGNHTMFKGVCLHHDLGPLGAADNRSALRFRLGQLKDMGCNAIRTSHNMPSQNLVELCDEMGIMLMVESFDEWDIAKCGNGYHINFGQWAEKDIRNMIRHFRNNPSVVMWSIGNEVPSQRTEDGALVCKWLQDICHREDPTRPVTCGLDDPDGSTGNGMASVLDIPGFNYKPGRYEQLMELLPQGFILGTETASTVSSRGIYHFPPQCYAGKTTEDHQCCSYDLEFCPWSNIPDKDFAADDDYPWLIGQFVWTGFDYLGEPTPYDTDAWPNHSSMFGIIDLASIPKDRYYLYRSQWNEKDETLHILPHWNWPGREGENTPVCVYTSYQSAELFVNGLSHGIRTFEKDSPLGRYRLIWDDVKYQPGNIRVVAYDGQGKPAEEKTVYTSGEPASIRLETSRRTVNGKGDLAYVFVTVVDRNGIPVPDATNMINVAVTGAGGFKAIANGDPTCLQSFHEPHMNLFSGALSFIVEGTAEPGNIDVKVSSKGLKPASVRIDNTAGLDTHLCSVVPFHDWLFSGKDRKLPIQTNSNLFNPVSVRAAFISDRSLMLEQKDTILVRQTVTEPGKDAFINLSSLPAGFYQVHVSCTCGNLSEKLKPFNIGIDPTGIICPEDVDIAEFDTFWDNTLEQLATIPMNTRMEVIPELSNDIRTSYKVYFQSWGGETAGGVACIPNKPGKYPVYLKYNGYGGIPVDRFDPASFPDRIQFSVSVRGQGIFHEKEERWIDRGLESKDNFYYRGAYCDVVRAIDFVCSLPEADTDRIFAYGESQGGAFSFVSAALDPRIRACAPAVPFMGDFTDYWKIVWWPVWEIFETAEKEGLDKDEVLEMLKWFDTKNFAHRITCPLKMSFGLQDTTCPPRTNFAPYNLVGSEKSYTAFPLCGHAMWREKDWNRQMEEFFKLSGSAESIHHRPTLAKSSSTEE